MCTGPMVLASDKDAESSKRQLNKTALVCNILRWKRHHFVRTPKRAAHDGWESKSKPGYTPGGCLDRSNEQRDQLLHMPCRQAIFSIRFGLVLRSSGQG
jgi:hypothetical protein